MNDSESNALRSHTICLDANCNNRMTSHSQFRCSACFDNYETNLKRENFSSTDEYYLHKFNGDQSAVECHKILLGDWYGMDQKDISNAFAEKIGLGTAKDHIERIRERSEAHSPMDYMSLDGCTVVINGYRYNSIRAFTDKKYPGNRKRGTDLACQIRRLIYDNEGNYCPNYARSRAMIVFSAKDARDWTGVPWSDRYKHT